MSTIFNNPVAYEETCFCLFCFYEINTNYTNVYMNYTTIPENIKYPNQWNSDSML